MLETLPTEVLALVCRWRPDRAVFRKLPATCRALRTKINSAEFLQERAVLARHGVSWAQLQGVSYAATGPMDDVRPFLPHTAALLAYLQQTVCVDWSAGSEHAPLTLDTSISFSGAKLFSDFPEACESLYLGDGDFVYDAGPRPCPWMLQIFRSGAPQFWHYGLRTLEPVSKGAFVCAYWGKHARVKGVLCRVDTQRMYRLTVSMEGEPPFTVDPTSSGNLARWINNARDDANLEPRLLERAGHRIPLVVLHAKRDIAAGEELLWDYDSTQRSPKGRNYLCGLFYKSHFGARWDERPGELVRSLSLDHPHPIDEMLRSESGQCLAASWAVAMPRIDAAPNDGRDRGKLRDVLAVQGLTPGPSSSPEERRLHESGCMEDLHELPALPQNERWADAHDISEMREDVDGDGPRMSHPREEEFDGWLGAYWPSHEVVRG